MAKELQADYARFVRAIREVSQERSMHVLVAIACIAATISWFRAERAIDESKGANAMVTAQATLIEQLSDDVATYRFQISLLHADLKAKGYRLPEEKE